jgi:hypothetical protein
MRHEPSAITPQVRVDGFSMPDHDAPGSRSPERPSHAPPVARFRTPACTAGSRRHAILNTVLQRMSSLAWTED